MAIAHELPLIGTVAMGLGLAFVCGLVAVRLGLASRADDGLAGIGNGPFTPHFLADGSIAAMILLMFGVGTHFSVRDLWAVRRIALPGAMAPIGVAALLGAAAAIDGGWSPGAGWGLGLALSVAGTVVLSRVLRERGLVDRVNGRIAVGRLAVEDLPVAVRALARAVPGPGGLIHAPRAKPES